MSTLLSVVYVLPTFRIRQYYCLIVFKENKHLATHFPHTLACGLHHLFFMGELFFHRGLLYFCLICLVPSFVVLADNEAVRPKQLRFVGLFEKRKEPSQITYRRFDIPEATTQTQSGDCLTLFPRLAHSILPEMQLNQHPQTQKRLMFNPRAKHFTPAVDLVWSERQPLTSAELDGNESEVRKKIDELENRAEEDRSQKNWRSSADHKKAAEDLAIELNTLQFFRNVYGRDIKYEVLAFREPVAGRNGKRAGELDLVIRAKMKSGEKELARDFIIEIKNTIHILLEQISKYKDDSIFNASDKEGRAAEVFIYAPAFRPRIRDNGEVEFHGIGTKINHLKTEIGTTPQSIKTFIDSTLRAVSLLQQGN